VDGCGVPVDMVIHSVTAVGGHGVVTDIGKRSVW